MNPDKWIANSIARQQAGITLQQAERTFKQLGDAAAKVKFSEGAELRLLLLRAWRRDRGVLRFLYPEWWRLKLG